MASFTASYGCDWIAAVQFGSVRENNRLDDYDITADIKALNDDVVLLSMSTTDGRLIITDAVLRRMEINIGWSDLTAPLSAGTYRFDFLFTNKTTGVRERDPFNGSWHTLTVPAGVTNYPSEA